MVTIVTMDLTRFLFRLNLKTWQKYQKSSLVGNKNNKTQNWKRFKKEKIAI